MIRGPLVALWAKADASRFGDTRRKIARGLIRVLTLDGQRIHPKIAALRVGMEPKA